MRLRVWESRFSQAVDERRGAADRFLASREAGDREAFVGAERRLRSVRAEAVALAEKGTDSGAYNDTNYIFLTFVLGYLPHGLIGLIMAGVFAAAMSSVSSELNSLATSTVVDHVSRYMRPGLGERSMAAGPAMVNAGLGGVRGRLRQLRRTARFH